MGIVYPNAAISRRWDGALQARLQRAPLEQFLSSRGAKPAAVSVSQDTDNLARATSLILEEGIVAYLRNCREGPSPAQQAMVGHLACVASYTLAETIARPEAWRIAALVSCAQLLKPWIGLKDAALTAACAARQFYRDGLSIPSIDAPIAEGARAAVAQCNRVFVAELCDRVASRLAFASPMAPNDESADRARQAVP